MRLVLLKEIIERKPDVEIAFFQYELAPYPYKLKEHLLIGVVSTQEQSFHSTVMEILEPKTLLASK